MAVNIEVCPCFAGCAGVGLAGDAGAFVSASYEGWAGFAKLSLDWVARPPALIEPSGSAGDHRRPFPQPATWLPCWMRGVQATRGALGATPCRPRRSTGKWRAGKASPETAQRASSRAALQKHPLASMIPPFSGSEFHHHGPGYVRPGWNWDGPLARRRALEADGDRNLIMERCHRAEDIGSPDRHAFSIPPPSCARTGSGR